MSVKTPVLGKDRTIRFDLFKKAKMFCVQKIIIFIFCVFKVPQCTHVRVNLSSM